MWSNYTGLKDFVDRNDTMLWRVNTSSFIRINNSIPPISSGRRTPDRKCVRSTITNEDDKCFNDRQFLLRFVSLSSICRYRIAFIEYFQQLWRGAEWNHSLWREEPFVTSVNDAFESSKTRSLAHWNTLRWATHHAAQMSCAHARQRDKAPAGVTHYVLKENNFGELDSHAR